MITKTTTPAELATLIHHTENAPITDDFRSDPAATAYALLDTMMEIDKELGTPTIHGYYVTTPRGCDQAEILPMYYSNTIRRDIAIGGNLPECYSVEEFAEAYISLLVQAVEIEKTLTDAEDALMELQLAEYDSIIHAYNE